ncbi:MAG: hypothetical protein ACOYD4_01400 [Solirubrobacterales bacterium]
MDEITRNALQFSRIPTDRVPDLRATEGRTPSTIPAESTDAHRRTKRRRVSALATARPRVLPRLLLHHLSSMSESPLITLARWEDHGAIWRVKSLGGDEAIVELLTCHGEPVDVLRSRDPELVRYLADRPTSEDPPPGQI